MGYTFNPFTGEIDTVNKSDIWNFFNGTFKESFNALATSAGGVVTLTVTNSVSGDLTMQFSDGCYVFDTSANGTIALTVGTDEIPKANYIYILKSTLLLTKSIIGFPAAEHIKIGYFYCPSAAYVASDGVYINQNWNDHLKGTDEMGHLTHLGERIRYSGANYFSGMDADGTDQLAVTSYYDYVSGTEAYFKMKAGVIYQMHQHTITAFDSRTDDIHIVNDFTTKFSPIHDIADIANDSLGNSLSGYYNLFFFQVGNKTGEYDPIMCQVPSGSYVSKSDAENDVDGKDNTSMPREFSLDSSTGVPICRLTLRKLGGNVTHISTKDLRNTSGGGGGGAGTDTIIRSDSLTVSASNSIHSEDADYICTGTNDQVTIQEASDTLTSGGSVVLLDGTFNMSDAIVPLANTRIKGQGNGTILKIPNSTNAMSVIDLTSVDNCIIQDLQIDGNKANNTAQHIGIKVDGCNNTQIVRCYIHDISGSIAGANGDGIWLDNAVANLLVDGCHIADCDDDGFDCESGGTLSYARIINNHITGSGDNGIDSEGIDHSTIANNTLYNNAGNAIEIEQEHTTPAFCVYNSVTGNSIDGNGGDVGIILSSASYNSVTGNSIENCTDGILIKTGNGVNHSTYNSIVGNTIQGCTTGINEEANQDYNYIASNVCDNTADYVISGTNTIVQKEVAGSLHLNQKLVIDNDIDADKGDLEELEITPPDDRPAVTINRGSDAGTGNIIEVFENNGTTPLFTLDYDGRIFVASQSNDPTEALGTAAGTSGSPAISLTGSDSSGEITLTSGSNPTASGVIATITFSKAFATAPSVILYPSNANASIETAGDRVPFTESTTTTFTLNGTGINAIHASTTFKWFYQVLGQ